MAGTADTTIPYTMSQALFNAAPPHSQLLLVEGGGHDNVAVTGGRKYTEAIQHFVGLVQPVQQLTSR
jgi:uncharacterized protein